MANATPHSDPNKTLVEMTLEGVNSHPLSIVGAFVKNAKRQGFNREWIEEVRKEAMEKDYNGLISTIMDNITNDDPNADED